MGGGGHGAIVAPAVVMLVAVRDSGGGDGDGEGEADGGVDAGPEVAGDCAGAAGPGRGCGLAGVADDRPGSGRARSTGDDRYPVNCIRPQWFRRALQPVPPGARGRTGPGAGRGPAPLHPCPAGRRWQHPGLDQCLAGLATAGHDCPGRPGLVRPAPGRLPGARACRAAGLRRAAGTRRRAARPGCGAGRMGPFPQPVSGPVRYAAAGLPAADPAGDPGCLALRVRRRGGCTGRQLRRRAAGAQADPVRRQPDRQHDRCGPGQRQRDLAGRHAGRAAGRPAPAGAVRGGLRIAAPGGRGRLPGDAGRGALFHRGDAQPGRCGRGCRCSRPQAAAMGCPAAVRSRAHRRPHGAEVRLVLR